MNFRLPFLSGMVLLVAMAGAFASTPPSGGPAKTQNGAPAAKAPDKTPPNPAATAKPAAVKPPASVLDNFLADLNETLKLTSDEKTDIQTYYLADGGSLRDILNNDALSSLQKAQQVADLRDKRDAKIEALLQDVDRRQEFYQIEAQYRVALTEFAANGGLAPAQPPAPAPAPSDIAPGQAEPNPTKNDGGA